MQWGSTTPQPVYVNPACRVRHVAAHFQAKIFAEKEEHFFHVKDPMSDFDTTISTITEPTMYYEEKPLKDHEYRFHLVFKDLSKRDLLLKPASHQRGDTLEEMIKKTLNGALPITVPHFLKSGTGNSSVYERIPEDILKSNDILLSLKRPIYLVPVTTIKPWKGDVLLYVSKEDKEHFISVRVLPTTMIGVESKYFFSFTCADSKAMVKTLNKNVYGVYEAPVTYYPRLYKGEPPRFKRQPDEHVAIVKLGTGKLVYYVFKSDTLVREVVHHLRQCYSFKPSFAVESNAEDMEKGLGKLVEAKGNSSNGTIILESTACKAGEITMRSTEDGCLTCIPCASNDSMNVLAHLKSQMPNMFEDGAVRKFDSANLKGTPLQGSTDTFHSIWRNGFAPLSFDYEPSKASVKRTIQFSCVNYMGKLIDQPICKDVEAGKEFSEYHPLPKQVVHDGKEIGIMYKYEPESLKMATQVRGTTSGTSGPLYFFKVKAKQVQMLLLTFNEGKYDEKKEYREYTQDSLEKIKEECKDTVTEEYKFDPVLENVEFIPEASVALVSVTVTRKSSPDEKFIEFHGLVAKEFPFDQSAKGLADYVKDMPDIKGKKLVFDPPTVDAKSFNPDTKRVIVNVSEGKSEESAKVHVLKFTFPGDSEIAPITHKVTGESVDYEQIAELKKYLGVYDFEPPAAKIDLKTAALETPIKATKKGFFAQHKGKTLGVFVLIIIVVVAYGVLGRKDLEAENDAGLPKEDQAVEGETEGGNSV